MRHGFTRVTVAAVAMCTALVPAPASADPPVLTITGSGPAFADVTLTAPLFVAFHDAVIHGDGVYAGFAVWQLGGSTSRPFGGVLASRDMHAPARPVTAAATWYHGLLAPLPFSPASVTLAPGRYRFHLLSDARAEIRMPLPPGAKGLTVTATRASRQTYSGQHAGLGATVTTAALRAPLAGRANTSHVVFARLGSGVIEDRRVTACLTTRNGSCATAEYAMETTGDGISYGASTSGVGARGALLRRTTRDARAEATVADCVGCALTLIYLAYDL